MDLELKIISATDLEKSCPFSSKIQTYVVVSISGATFPDQKTPVDADGGRNPNWNHSLTFSIPRGFAVAGDLTLKFQIRSRRSLAADNLIGEVCVPLRDFMNSAGGFLALANFVSYHSYQVKKPSGRPKGVLTFSYRFNGKIGGAVSPVEQVMDFPAKPQSASAVYSVPADVYPPPPKPVLPATGYPAVDGYRYDVYPPSPVSSIPAMGQTSYGYPAQRGLRYGYPVKTVYGFPDQTRAF